MLACSEGASDDSSSDPNNPNGQGSSQGSGASGGSAQGEAGRSGVKPGGTGGASVGSQAGTGGDVAEPGGKGGTPGNGSGGTAPVTPSGNTFYIGPNGSDRDPGTKEQPFRTLARANEVAKPGHTFWVMQGSYSYTAPMLLSKSGAEGNPIRVEAMPGARPVLDYGGQQRGDGSLRGIEIKGDFWHLKGLEIKNAADNGILISGSHNVVEDVVLHGNGDTGLQITVSSALATNDTRGAHNLVLNCDSYENAGGNGENPDGFAAKLRIGPGNIFRGCRAWSNADDGWDLFAADDVVVIEDSWAFLNGKARRRRSCRRWEWLQTGRQAGRSRRRPCKARRDADCRIRQQSLRLHAEQQHERSRSHEVFCARQQDHGSLPAIK